MVNTDVKRRPMVVVVRDGWGRNPHGELDQYNAVKLAHTPCCDALLQKYPWTLIKTCGEDVGLPAGTMGNSEVGHQNIGAGRIVNQESVRITKAIRTGDFFTNPVLTTAVASAKRRNQFVHLLGIASDAGVHGMLDHLYGCLNLCKHQGMPGDKVALHLFTDGRDTGPFTGKAFIDQIELRCESMGIGKIASICGRYYAMDRDNRWERVEKAYGCLTGIRARKQVLPIAATATEAIERYYDNPTSSSMQGDEFIVPTMIGQTIDDALPMRISDLDTVIFYNYRGDRPREIIKAFMYTDKQWGEVSPSPDSGERGFKRVRAPATHFVTMTAYESGLPVKVAYPKEGKMVDIAGDYFSNQGMTQFRSAETEKFPHVTFFFNDYREEPFEGETRGMAQSPKVSTYDLKPEMSAGEVRDLVLGKIREDETDVIVVNFANGDMVGHTGKLDAAIKAIETVDGCVGELVEAVRAKGGCLIVTADHGNAEQTFDLVTNAAHTAHTLYDVECILVDPTLEHLASGSGDVPSEGLRGEGRLADVMPTLLGMMGLEKPEAMTGTTLVGGRDGGEK